jgi:hypothetical protein
MQAWCIVAWGIKMQRDDNLKTKKNGTDNME